MSGCQVNNFLTNTDCSMGNTTDGANIRPAETLTPKNLELAAQNMGGVAQSMDALIQASELPENQDFAEYLLNRARQFYEIGRDMNAASPV